MGEREVHIGSWREGGREREIGEREMKGWVI